MRTSRTNRSCTVILEYDIYPFIVCILDSLHARSEEVQKVVGVSGEDNSVGAELGPAGDLGRKFAFDIVYNLLR